MEKTDSQKVISIRTIKYKKAAKRGFREWRALFQGIDPPDERTKWSDLPDWLLLFLGEESHDSRLTLYGLLMGSLGLGEGREFESLPAAELMPLMDIYFLLMDHIRFECMRRLGWVTSIPEADKSIIEMLLDAGDGQCPILLPPPVPTSSHPAYSEDREAGGIDRSRLIRQYIPEAIKNFRIKNG